MARVNYTTTDLVNAIRSMLSENNPDQLDTTEDIFPALNRAQDYAYDIYARKYPDPFITYETLNSTSGTAEYTIPENVFEDRIVKIEVAIPQGGRSSYTEVVRASFRDISVLETPSLASAPSHYVVVGRSLRFLPTPNGAYDFRIWYVSEPRKLVPVGGRITNINIASNYISVDAAGSSLSSSSSDIASYVNLVNGRTGEIRATLQVQSISGTTITFRSSPISSSIFGLTVVGAIPSTVAKNDYICLASGTCVPGYSAPTTNFLIQYVTAEMTRKLGGEAVLEEQILQKFEQQVEKTWAGREVTFRIRKSNPIWGSSLTNRRIYPNTSN